jgi:hypothetical protein
MGLAAPAGVEQGGNFDARLFSLPGSVNRAKPQLLKSQMALSFLL